jgi:hypothetical protein
MVNNMLLFNLWYFVNVWKNWDHCCEKKKVEDLGLVDPSKALKVLVSKWVLHAFELGDFNLQEFLRFRLRRFQPHKAS